MAVELYTTTTLNDADACGGHTRRTAVDSYMDPVECGDAGLSRRGRRSM